MLLFMPSGAIAVSAAGPPQDLTSNGRVLWNLDALLHYTFGGRVVCYDGRRVAIFSVPGGSGCPAPQARYQPWAFTFRTAHASAFRLVERRGAPVTGATTVPVQVASRYVSCPGGLYHDGKRGWLVFGGGAGPTGLFWCS